MTNPYEVARIAYHTSIAMVGLAGILIDEYDHYGVGGTLQSEIAKYTADPRIQDQAYLIAIGWAEQERA